MYVANASGCSSAYGGPMPTTPYCTESRGFGPCWEQSLFEDNAEFAFGFLRAHESINGEMVLRVKALKEKGVAVSEIGEYLAKWQDPAVTREVSDALIAALEKAEPTEEGAFVLQNKEYLTKKSVWAFGGDGWAYDIGFGGIDHVLAQNRDINMLVMDTEVYSNTGGQSSKATPTAAVAKFAAGGKEVKKKDLGAIAMSYGYIYVAQVAMGYDQAQTLKAIREAESYPGPAIVIAYCPCLEHGIKAGMSCTQEEMKKAVECGYWHLYRYDPRRIAEGKNPFQLDSPEPDSGKMMDYLKGENRYASLQINFPDRAQRLYEKTVQDAKDRYAKYRKMAEDSAFPTLTSLNQTGKSAVRMCARRFFLLKGRPPREERRTTGGRYRSTKRPGGEAGPFWPPPAGWGKTGTAKRRYADPRESGAAPNVGEEERPRSGINYSVSKTVLKSSMISSGSSRPTLMRTKPSEMPAAASSSAE